MTDGVTDNVQVRLAHPDEISHIAAAYARWEYGGRIQTEDTAWLAELNGDLIGAVRIVRENDTLVLRGMRVADGWRRAGIGTRLLRAIAPWLDNRPCYCVPYSYLESFYGQIGFRQIPAVSSPSFLTLRTVQYRQIGLDVIIMARTAGLES